MPRRRSVVDGRGLAVARREIGGIPGPFLVDHVRLGRCIDQEEIFGPVLGVVRVQTRAEAMALIDAHEDGNGSCIFTRDGEAARHFSDPIEVGMVGIRISLPVPVASHSFGG